MKYFFVWLMAVAPLLAGAQNYRIRQFSVEDGLPSNIIKGVTQDDAGFFWIATDEGIAKFDGTNFTIYKNALHNQYAKGFLKTADGRLFLYGDLDLTEIRNEIDTVIFKPILRGTRIPSDSTLYYPKSIYEDQTGNLWISEPQSVVRLRKGRMVRFSFAMEDRSPVFLRSFSFFEDRNGFVYAVSYSGNLYEFDFDEFTFIPHGAKFPASINDIKVIGNQLWMAAADGVYTANLLRDGGITKPEKLWPFQDASHILLLDSNRMIVTTFQQEHYAVDYKKKVYRDIGYSINTVNNSYQSNENDLWFSSNQGLILLQSNLFNTVSTPDVVTFTEAIAEDPVTSEIYHCTRENLYKYVVGPGRESRKILSIPEGYFQSLGFSSHGLWTANAFTVSLMKNERIIKSWDFEKDGRFIHDLYVDRQQNVWLSQAGNRNVLMISPSLELERFPVPLLSESVINCVRQGPGGVYLASNGADGYLFMKRNGTSDFVNVSAPINLDVEGEFNVTDLVATDSVVWLASSEGLLRYDGKVTTRVDLGDVFTKAQVKSVKFIAPHYLCFNNSYGLFRFDMLTHDFWLYDESSGLPSNTITTRGIFVDNHNRVWAGTSAGLAYSSRSLLIDRPTIAPQFVSARINGVDRRFMQGVSVPFGAFFIVGVSCNTFPSNKVQIQYRIAEVDSRWHAAQNHHINLADLSAGRYTIEARAKKNGGYTWSESKWLSFTVEKAFWQQPWFMASALLLIVLIAWSSFGIAQYFNKKRRAYLEAIVNQRTIELKRINDELSMRNSELDRFVYSASHDLSAPLKSIRGLIAVATMEKPDNNQLSYLQMMERSVRKLEAFITDVINYSRNTRMPVKHSPIEFKSFIRQLLDDHQYAPNYGKIKFIVEDFTTSNLVSDEMRMKIIFNNLISNAIKFHHIRPDREPYVRITAAENESHFIFTVDDNGMGIHRELKDKIFEMFFRATDSVQGSGLGLYILKETVARLQGKVEVDTELERGTRFTILLPK